MNISIDNLRQLDSLEIYELFKKDFDNYYNNYKNIVISYEEFKNIVLEEIEESKSNNFIDYKQFIIKRIDSRLKVEQEIVEDTNYQLLLNDLKSYPLLTQEEFDDLIVKAQNNDQEAIKKIVNHNMKLVISNAKRYLGCGLELEDLIQEGTFGLFEAIERFDTSKGFKFSTYATYWIRSYIHKAINECGRLMKLPTNQIDAINKYKKVYKALIIELKREPTIEEIAQKLEISYDKCLQLYNLQIDPVSINKKINTEDGEDTEFGDFIESPVNIERDIVHKNLIEEVDYAFINAKLTEKEKYVIIYRFGLFGCERKTLESIGEDLNVTRERVRQIEYKALVKIKRSFNSRKLAGFINENESESIHGFTIGQYNNISSKIPKKYFKYFFECGLTPIEMEVIAYSMGLIDNKERNYREISEVMNLSITDVTNIQKTSLKKLKSIPKKYSEFQEEFEKKQEEFVKNSDLCKKLKCTFEELEIVKLQLLPDELELLNKRDNDDFLRTMKVQEMVKFNEELFLKIRKLLKENRKKVNSNIYEELLEIERLLGEEKNKKVIELSNTKVFAELRKYFSLKGVVVVLLLFGYIDGTYYSSDSISVLLNIKSEDVNKIYQKANSLFRTNNVLETDKKEKMIKELKIN